jgi:hypothetical protein
MLKADALGPLRPPAPRSPLAETPTPDLGVMDLAALRALRREAQQEEADLSYLRRMLHGRIDILQAETGRRRAANPEEGSGADASVVPDQQRARHGADGPAADGPAADRAGVDRAGVDTAAAEAREGGGRAGADRAGGAVAADAPLVGRLSEILADGPSRVRSSARHVTLGTPLTERVRRLAEEMLSEVELSDLEARTDDELHDAMGRLVRHEQQVSRRRQALQHTVDGCSAEITRRYRDGEAHVDDLLAGG